MRWKQFLRNSILGWGCMLIVPGLFAGDTIPPSNTGKVYTYAYNSCITETVTNVMLNGMRDTLFTTPNVPLNVSFDWMVQYAPVFNCMPNTVINYVNGLEHVTGSCITQDYFEPDGSRTKTVSYSASTPSTPGTYYLNLGAGIGSGYTCSANATLINTVPLGNGPYTIGVVIVTDGGGGNGGSVTTTTTNNGNYWQPNSNGIYYNGGNVGINCTTTNSKLDVNGSIAINHVQVIDGGGKWTGQPITGLENVTPRISGNGYNAPLDIAQQGATNGQVLKWNGSSWAPGADNGDGSAYTIGNGLTLTGNTLSANSNSPIWNANELQNIPVMTITPQDGQYLYYNAGQWFPNDLPTPVFRAGPGITVDGNLISAETTSPLWNANQLSGHNVGTITPETGQVLQWNGVAWVPENLAPSSAEASGWTMDTVQGGVVNLLSTVNGSVGIGTDDPQAELDVFGGIAVKGIQVINDSGQWVGPVVIDSATQALMDTMEAQQAAISASMDQLKQAQDSLTAGIAVINQGSATIKQGDSLLMAATNSADSAAAQAMIAIGQAQIASGQATVEAGQAQSSAAQADMAATISALSATLSAASAAIAAASATAAVIAAVEASAAAAEASIAAGEATVAAAEATGAAVEASLAALEATGAASDATADAADASADAATASTKAKEASDAAKDAKGYRDQAKDYAEGSVGGDLSGNMPNPTVAKIQGHAVSSTTPTANKVLKYINNQWQPAVDSNTTYRAGTGITIRHDSIFGQNTTAIWNASKLQGGTVTSTLPATNQVLKWRNNTWTPANDSSVTYKAGTGITIRHDSIFAQSTTAIWNAAALQGRAVDTVRPDSGQLLAWNGAKWQPITPAHTSASGWAVDTMAGDTILYATVPGSVGIGTATPSANFKLSVNGAIRAKKVVVESGWADYVFEPAYRLRPLPELRKYIAENHHLPGVESADAIAENGLDIAQTQRQMMEKIEELTLYLLEMEAQNARMAAEMQYLKTQFYNSRHESSNPQD